MADILTHRLPFVAASELGLSSFFTQVQIQSLPGSLQESMSNLSPDNLKKMTFSYPRSLEDLLQDVASLHESASAAPTSLIIVDRLEGYLHGPGVSGGLQQAEQSSAAQISALLFDMAAFLTQTLEERAASLVSCRIIASFQSEWEGHAGGDSSDPVLSVLDRYFQVRCTLDRDWNSAPAVAGPQDTWHVYLSGAGMTEAPIAKDEEDSSLAREWRLVICPNRSMEFTMV
ncbi:uncharacterized protein LOC120045784 [Salvelinus namaycush]|uniref:Uncharacterized protein LOC120045784 n=1 Tax=Salvelinus namaycush TaxID=8040 RepID=A0A8U0QMR0_SALNM|nr:uncharacterized protein LOC120045784 [Salvelinus namaycush]